MHDQRVGRPVRRLDAGDRAALQPLAGIGERALIGHLGDPEPLQPDAEPRRVHHGEHGAHALVRPADQPADGAVEAERAGRRGADAHLVLEGGAGHGVAAPGRAVLVGQEFRHQEQADAARAGGRAHHAVLEMAALLVARPVERRQLVLAELGAGGEDGGDGVRRRLLMAGQPGDLPDIEQLLEHEAHVAQRRLVGRHRSALSRRRRRSRITTEAQRHRGRLLRRCAPQAFLLLCVSVSLW